MLGILGIFCCLGIVLGPVAFFLGHSALGRIRNSGGALGGAGMAQAGRILGVIDTLLWLVLLVVVGVSVAVRNSSG